MSEPVTKTRQAIAEEAAEWFVEFQGRPPGRPAKRRFMSWLTESPVHVEEYLAIAKVFGALQYVDPKGEIDADSLVDATVVALYGEVDGLIQGVWETDCGSRFTGDGGRPDQRASPVEPDQRRRRRQRNSWVAAAALVLGVGVSVLYIQGTGPEVYSTRLGEQRSVVLEDGSMVSLNTSTTIEVAYTEETRHVHLIEGEALFDVEKDVTRPFQVETRAAVIQVTGTQFNVYDKDDGTAVTVLEGTVEVVPREAAPRTSSKTQSTGRSVGSAGGFASLTTGDQVVVRSGTGEVETTTIASLQPVTAWTERRLVFDSTPLSEIVQQFNRYNRKRLVLDDPSLAPLELSGVFNSYDPESLVLFLKRISEVQVVTSADGTEIRIRAATTVP